MRNWKVIAIGMAGLAGVVWAGPKEATTYQPNLPSQQVSCNGISHTMGNVPKGDGDGIVTDAEVGAGGWRYNSRGKSIITQRYTLNASKSGFDVTLGQSNFIGNRGIVNDFPRVLDNWAYPVTHPLNFSDAKAELVLTGDPYADPPRFAYPGKGSGTVRIPMKDPDKDGVWVGCKSTPWLANNGLLVPEGGNYLQQSHYKVFAQTDENGNVTMLEWTEIVMFKNVDPNVN